LCGFVPAEKHQKSSYRTALHTVCAADYRDYSSTEDEDEEARSRFDINVFECVKILLQNEASIDISDEEGNDPLHLACGYNTIPNPQLVRVLCEKGATSSNAPRSC
jgi:ankyrin repeat protein